MPTTQPLALSLRRPWAHLCLHRLKPLDIKPVENRSWPTNHRGTIYLHASKTWDTAFAKLAAEHGTILNPDDFPTGYLGTVTLTDCHLATGDCCPPWGDPQLAGHRTYHWRFTNPHPFRHPLPGPGAQRLYTVPATVLTATAPAHG